MRASVSLRNKVTSVRFCSLIGCVCVCVWCVRESERERGIHTEEREPVSQQLTSTVYSEFIQNRKLIITRVTNRIRLQSL